ncbi:hypothetical protein, partial [Pseudomonas sp. 2822-17]|uniref:hypothetical protein n=1 Tax=Pseudomonas sp. 2822-17 TaxID=1712678 RepID=UPI001C49464A
IVVARFVIGVSFLFSDPKEEHAFLSEVEQGILEMEIDTLLMENAKLYDRVQSLEKSLENFGKNATVYMNRDVFLNNA